MEIKAILEKPYTENQRIDFIVEQNHRLGYEIRETDEQLQAWGYTQEEIKQQEEQKEQERKSKLKMTKRDFFLYVVMPYGITYAQLMQALSANDTIYACYEGCNHIYRYDTMLVGNIKSMLESLSGQTIDEQVLNAQLDSIFEDHNATD